MELRQSGPALWTEMAEAFEERNFLRKLGMTRSDVERVFGAVDWRQILAPFTPLRTRVSCAAALESFRPLLLSLAPEPPEALTGRAAESMLPSLQGAGKGPGGEGPCPALPNLTPNCNFFDTGKGRSPWEPQV